MLVTSLMHHNQIDIGDHQPNLLKLDLLNNEIHLKLPMFLPVRLTLNLVSGLNYIGQDRGMFNCLPEEAKGPFTWKFLLDLASC